MPKCPDKFTPKSTALQQPAVSHLYAIVVHCACAHLKEGPRWLAEKTFLYCGFSLFSKCAKVTFRRIFFWLFKWCEEWLFFCLQEVEDYRYFDPKMLRVADRFEVLFQCYLYDVVSRANINLLPFPVIICPPQSSHPV